MTMEKEQKRSLNKTNLIGSFIFLIVGTYMAVTFGPVAKTDLSQLDIYYVGLLLGISVGYASGFFFAKGLFTEVLD